MKIKYWLWLFLAWQVGCMTEGRQHVLSAELISLKTSDLPPVNAPHEAYTTVKMCADDPAPKVKVKHPDTWGPLNFLLDKAHRDTGATHFAKATVYNEEFCMILRGFPIKDGKARVL